MPNGMPGFPQVTGSTGLHERGVVRSSFGPGGRKTDGRKPMSGDGLISIGRGLPYARGGATPRATVKSNAQDEVIKRRPARVQ